MQTPIIRFLISTLLFSLAGCGGGTGATVNGQQGGGDSSQPKTFARHLRSDIATFATSFDTHADGSTYLAGGFAGEMNVGTDGMDQILASTGSVDGFLARYAADGSVLWIQTAECPFDTSIFYDIEVLLDGSILVVGSAEADTTFGDGTPSEVTIAISNEEGFVAKYSPAGEFLWVRKISSSEMSRPYEVAATPGGSFVVGGSFKKDVTIGEGNSANTLTTIAGLDGFLAHYASNGTKLWVRAVGGTGHDILEAVDIDANGDIYVGGSFSETITFGAGELNQTTFVESKKLNGYVAKYSAIGSLKWVRGIGGPEHDSVANVRAHPDGGVLASGDFRGLVVWAGGGAFQVGQSVGEADLFLTRYDDDGKPMWVHTAGGSGNDYGGSIDVSSNGVIAVGGSYQTFVTFAAGEANETTVVVAGGRDGIVTFLHADGTLRNLFHATCDVDGSASALAHANGDWAIAGNMNGPITLNPSHALNHSFFGIAAYDCYVGRIHNDGTF